MKKEITKKGYRTLAIIWTLAAASMGVAFVRRLAEFNLLLLLLFVLSALTASNLWKTYKQTPERMRRAAAKDPFSAPPKFNGTSVPFDDDPPPAVYPNQNSEEKKP